MILKRIFVAFVLIALSGCLSTSKSQEHPLEGNAEGFDFNKPKGITYYSVDPGYECRKGGETVASYRDSIVVQDDGRAFRTGNSCSQIAEPLQSDSVQRFIMDDLVRVDDRLFDLAKVDPPTNTAAYTESYCQMTHEDINQMDLLPEAREWLRPALAGFGAKITVGGNLSTPIFTSLKHKLGNTYERPVKERSVQPGLIRYSATEITEQNVERTLILELQYSDPKQVDKAHLIMEVPGNTLSFPVSCWLDLR